MFKLICSALLFIAAIQSSAAQVTQDQANKTDANVWMPASGLRQIPIWPNGAPDRIFASGTTETMQIKKAPEVAPDREYTQILDVTTPTMTIFPPKGVNTGVAMVVFPGGGFRILAIDLEGSEICDWVTSKGMSCVLLKYHVPKGNHYWDKDCKCHIRPKIPYALQDAERTIRLVRAKAADLGIAPNKIGVIGFSAGGYLVAQTSNLSKSSYKPIDAADAQSSRPDFAIALYPGHLCRAGKKFDPSLQVTKNTPPTFLLQAWDDPIDNNCNSIMYARALSDAKVPTELHLFAKGGHAFGLRNNPHPISSWPSLLENWLRELEILPPLIRNSQQN